MFPRSSALVLLQQIKKKTFKSFLNQEEQKDVEETESVYSVTVYKSLLKDVEKLLPGFSIKCFQNPPKKETRKGSLFCWTKFDG